MKLPTLLAIVTGLSVSIAPACAAAKAKAEIVKADAIACAKQNLGATVEQAGMSLLATVLGVFVADGTNWSADLDALAAKYGPEALACASKIAADVFHPAQAGSNAPQGLMTAENPADVAYGRAQSAMAKYSSGRSVQ